MGLRRLTRNGAAAGTSVALCLAVFVPGALSRPTAIAASKTCRSITASHGTRFQVTVTKGPVSCFNARWVLRTFLSGKGTMHGPPGGPAYLQYWTVSGWNCGYGTGGGGCSRDRRQILAQSY